MANVLRPFLEHYAERGRLALEAAGSPAERIISVSPGEMVAWDDAEQGLLYVRVITVEPKLGPRGATNVLCGIESWRASAAIGVLRCAAGVTDNGFPSAAQITDDGIEMTDDFTALMQAVLGSRFTHAVAGWNPLGPEGYVHGGEWLFTFDMPLDVDTEDDGS